ncbi:MAG: porin [Caldimonas sp.]|uniref:porin n=1 Tax=Caldimonas taiwanensis TaxID=307483 RepID=UPI0007812981|nr:porin [Caldimonas taiwanensis]GIX23619.1 MAG: porin [Caldimonas sp.]
MKKLPIAVAAVAALAAGSALAQSNVNIYGRMNVSVERQKAGGQSLTGLVNNASRIGFRGTEDLGGGLKAGFVLEHGFNIDTGAQTQTEFWARQAELNLSGGFGMLRLGRYTSEAYFATADYVSMHNHDTGTSSDALYAYITRDTNKIAYRTPDLGGLTVEAAMSLKEAAANHSYDLAANYGMGPLQLGAGYSKLGDQNQFALRALYTLGDFTFGGYVQRDEDGFGAGLGKRTNVRLSGIYAMGASEFHLNVGRAGEYDNVNDSDATQFTLGYNYNLSKRTKLYAFYTKLNDGSASVYGGDFSSVALGLRHNF